MINPIRILTNPFLLFTVSGRNRLLSCAFFFPKTAVEPPGRGDAEVLEERLKAENAIHHLRFFFCVSASLRHVPTAEFRFVPGPAWPTARRGRGEADPGSPQRNLNFFQNSTALFHEDEREKAGKKESDAAQHGAPGFFLPLYFCLPPFLRCCPPSCWFSVSP